MLTDAQCRGAKGRPKPYKLTDGRGLYLFVSTTGHRSWRWRYRSETGQQTLTLGSYPDMSLAEARAAREQAAQQRRNGIDPKAKHQPGITFEEMARDWHARRKGSWSEGHARSVLSSMEQEAFPIMGRVPIADVTSATVLRVLDPMVARGAIDQAHRLRQRLSDVFVLGIVAGVCESDPAAVVRKALPPVAKRKYPALTSIEDARAFLIADAEMTGFPSTKLASRLMALTAVRSEPLRFAEPREFEALEGDSPIWRIPAAKMKLGVDRRKQAELEFVVPLSRQAVETVKLALQLGGGRYVFPDVRFLARPMSENALSSRYRRMPAFAGRHVPHGWRSTFSTIMNERAEREGRAGDRAIIDLMLAHVPSGVEPTYNRAAYMPRRRELAQEWADLLLVSVPPADDLLEGRRR